MTVSAVRPLQAVLFDRDDTLTRTDHAVYREAALWTAREFGLDAGRVERALAAQWAEQAGAWWDLRTEEDEAAFWTAYAGALAGRLGLDMAHTPALMAAFPYERYLKPVAGAREVLEALRARGLQIGVLSNTLPSIGRTLEAVGLADLVDVAVASCTVGAHKPEARAFQATLERLGLPAGAVLFVDDRPENVEAARALGMPAALIDHTGRTPGALHSLSAVLDLVEGGGA
ncbi:HAD family hydrolase [Deinococcus budaensis]|uniref:Putative hydrolase of the HAD superfamily n=1 Tax=Deinococcus budaensis TaxID=1665626 RepID=A0A7W8LNU0_9DEIO|nr:HAD family hydrolase [Deinococcus budaensis]MBB5232927.1 putative hydrolase of the HAD superfamily [Deinococcus budaensis]